MKITAAARFNVVSSTGKVLIANATKKQAEKAIIHFGLDGVVVVAAE